MTWRRAFGHRHFYTDGKYDYAYIDRRDPRPPELRWVANAPGGSMAFPTLKAAKAWIVKVTPLPKRSKE